MLRLPSELKQFAEKCQILEDWQSAVHPCKDYYVHLIVYLGTIAELSNINLYYLTSFVLLNLLLV